MQNQYDLIVAGAGSGGIGAALAAARMGLSVLLIEKSDCIGGNAVRGGVHNWEPGVGGTSFPFEIYTRLKQKRDAVCITRSWRHCMLPSHLGMGYPGGESIIDARASYLNTLQRFHDPAGLPQPRFGPGARWRAVGFEPDAYCEVVEDLLSESGNCTVRKNTAFEKVEMEGRDISALKLTSGEVVRASFYVDATAEIHLARAAGCATLVGEDAHEKFNEPGAPEQNNFFLNGVTLIYRVTPVAFGKVEPLSPTVPSGCWWSENFPGSVHWPYPNGDLNINMLPTMSGADYRRMPRAAAYEECRKRVLAHWHHLQTFADFPEFKNYRLRWIAPAMGVREGHRLISKTMLTSHDIRLGMNRQSHPDVIALCDHPMDFHGGKSTGQELTAPYGVPYRALLPRDCNNLLVACRGAGFSAQAASSCRLSRTMMAMGHAAGVAAALARDDNCALEQVEPAELRAALTHQHADLEWPRSSMMLKHLVNDQSGTRRSDEVIQASV